MIIRGKAGGDLTLEQGRQAARMTALSTLATLQAGLGDLDRIERIVKIFGMVNVAPGFDQTPAVSIAVENRADRAAWRPGEGESPAPALVRRP